MREEARRRLAAPGGGRPGSGQWHVLEGITRIDCAIFARRVTVFIEGKRTEPKLTDKTEWHRQRHQVVRNLDCLRADPSRAEQWFVLLVVEEESRAHSEAKRFDADRATLRKAAPHLPDAEALALWNHYLGFTTWQEIQRTFGLAPYPETVDARL